MDNTSKFTGRATIYSKSRPKYSVEFIDFLYNNIGIKPHSIIADIGSGTGIFSKELLERGNSVYCVEPNTDMRKSAEDMLKDFQNFHSIEGTAEHTTLPANSVDFITVAQAFHWFDREAFRRECKRIGKPDNKVILIWNSRVTSSNLVKENAQICKKYCPNFKGFSGGMENPDAYIRQFFGDQYETKRFENNLEFDKVKFVDRNLSASYSIKEGDEGYKNYIFELESLFDKYAIGDTLIMENDTVAYIGKL